MATLKERMDRHDREIAAIRKLVQAGMKMVVRMEQEHLAFREDMREMKAYQRETGRQLRELKDAIDRVVRSIQRGEGNGHKDNRIE